MKSSSVLIIGGAGFVGSNLCLKLLEEEVAHITILDNLLSADISNIPDDKRIQFVEGTCTDDRILKKVGTEYDYVFHLATYHGNQSSIHDPIADHENNTYTTLKLCEHFKGVPQLKKMVYASAGCVVAEKTFDLAKPTTEDTSISLYLDSPYQISKIIGEFYGNYYHIRHQLPFVKARFQNVYGPREILGAGRWRGTPATVWRNVTPSFIWKALNGEALPIDNGGIATRDFIYVEDIALGLIACAKNGQNGDVYNLASGIETPIKDLGEMICQVTGNKAGLDVKPARDWDRSGKRFGDTTKTFQEIGFKAETTLFDGLEKTVSWTKSHQNLISQNINKHAFYMPEIKKYAA